MSESAAIPLLESLGFKVKVEYEPSKDVEKDIVIRSDPQRTEVVEPGEKITLYISSGEPTKNVRIPDVVGFSKDNAEKKLKAEDLAVIIEEVQITMDDKFYPVGTVVKQEPERSSAEVPEGTEVKIYVCTGYKYDVVLDDLPTDYKTESYHITLWENGTMIDKGDKINSKEKKSYTFDGLVATGTKVNLTVKISSDGTNEENLYDVTVDNENGRVKVVKEYEYTTKSDELSNSNGGSIGENNTTETETDNAGDLQ
jgi:beta-lactam-binding protein with PASTA domain